MMMRKNKDRWKKNRYQCTHLKVIFTLDVYSRMCMIYFILSSCLRPHLVDMQNINSCLISVTFF